MELTTFERHALMALAETARGDGMRPSAVGHVIWEKCDPETRKRNPSPQGLALFAGKFLHRLCEAKLVTSYNGYTITAAGRAALEGGAA